VVSSVFSSRKFYPSVNVKYTPTRQLVFRLGYSKSIGLPDYDVLLPATTITDPTSTARGQIQVYNPGIKEYQVDNFDAGVEYYFSHSGYVAASVFRKNIKNYIATLANGVDDNTLTQYGISTSNILNYPSGLNQYDLIQKVNVAGTGHYNGIELAYAQNFTFLPKPFNTIGLQVNGTIVSIDPIKTNQVFSATEPSLQAAALEQINKNLELATGKQSLNVSLSYSLGKFGLNIQSNYTGHVLKTITRKTIKYSDETANRYFNELQYQAPRELVDVRLDYKYSRLITPYVQARNIMGRPIIMSTPTLPINHAEYGDPIYEIGIRGVW
jgi:TonB-dependent receptor